MRKRRNSTDGPADISRRRRLREADDDDFEEEWEGDEVTVRLRRARVDEDDDDDDEPGQIRALRPRRAYPNYYPNPEHELSDVLRTLDYHREGMQEQTSYLQTLLQCNPELAVRWQQFTSAGGVTAEDWERFLAGDFRSRITRTRRHMRLVSNRPLRIRLRRRQNDDPEGAA